MRGQKRVNLPRLAPKELLHLIYTVLLNYSCSLTQEVYCCFLLSDALVHLEVEEHRGMTAPSGPTENRVRCISDTLLKKYCPNNIIYHQLSDTH